MMDYHLNGAKTELKLHKSVCELKVMSTAELQCARVAGILLSTKRSKEIKDGHHNMVGGGGVMSGEGDNAVQMSLSHDPWERR